MNNKLKEKLRAEYQNENFNFEKTDDIPVFLHTIL